MYASEGTAAAALAERCLIEKVFPSRYAGWFIKLSDKYGGKPLFLNPLTCTGVEGFEVNSEMVDAITGYLDSIYALGLPKLYVEQRVSVEHLVPGMFGTPDCYGFDEKNGILWVIDLKFGAGVIVSPEWNHQEMIYSLGILGKNPPKWLKEIRQVIYQPRHRNGGWMEWAISTDDLIRWGQDVLIPGAKATEDPNAPLVPGDKQCRWCAAKAVCPALLGQSLEVAQVAFKDIVPAEVPTLTFPNPMDMTPMERAKVASLLTALDDYRASFFQYLQELAERGDNTPGWKLVRGKANRKWKSEALVVNQLEGVLGDLLWEKKLLSPAKLEKIKGIDKKALAALWETPEGKITLAPESDKRPAVVPAALNPFNFDDL